jgi:GNAT superfamily N-acetyltransferase
MSSDGFEISTDRSRLDLPAIHEFLAGSYWALGRPRQLVERTIENSVCFGGYVASRQVAFGRIITDTVAIAYFADIFVLPEWRGRGFGKAIVRAMVEYTDKIGVNVTLLKTQGARALYEPFGFEPISEQRGLMGRSKGR